nr:MAG TPA: hypothetical protein [Caudoviricetes sp.]
MRALFFPLSTGKIVDPVIRFRIIFDERGDHLELFEILILAQIAAPIWLAAIRQSSVTVLGCTESATAADLQDDKFTGFGGAGTSQAAFLGIESI